MIRIFLENLLLFLLPTLIYVAYALLRRSRSEDADTPEARSGTGVADAKSLMSDAPLLYLFAAGLFLMVATLVFFSSNSGGRTGQSYTPPVLKDGRVEPGHFD